MAKIIVVDDEEQLRYVIKSLLEKKDHVVLEAENGEEGLKLIRAEKPDLVILDIMMPRMNGWEVAGEMKVDMDLADIPIIILSVKARDEDIFESVARRDADAHIPKPFKTEQLMDMVEALLEKSREE